jgi:hypothetical protein
MPLCLSGIKILGTSTRVRAGVPVLNLKFAADGLNLVINCTYGKTVTKDGH